MTVASIKYIDEAAVEDTDTVTGKPYQVNLDNLRSVSFHVHVNRTGTGDLEGAVTIEKTNDPRVITDIATGTTTADWIDISSSLTIPTFVAGSEEEGDINVSFLSAVAVRLIFTGSGGTDGSVEVWAAGISG